MASARRIARTRLRRRRVLNGPVRAVLFSLSWPMSLGLFSVIAFNVVDTLYIGQLGAGPLAAIGYCFPVIFCLSAVAIGMGNGATSVVSRALGRGEYDHARALTTDTVLFVGVVSILLAAGMHYAAEGVFGLLAVPAELMPLVRAYMDVWFMGLPFLILPIVLNGLIRASGDALFPSSMMVLAAGINAVLSPFLIFGLLGAPDLGIAGGAYATVAARGVLTVLCFGYLLRADLLGFAWHGMDTFLRSVAEILRFGAPAYVAQAVSPLSSFLVTRLLSAEGPEAVAAYTVGARIESLALVPLFALQSGIGPFVGQNVGADRHDRLGAAEREAWRFVLIAGSVIGVGLFAFGEDIARLFTDDFDIITMADRFLALIATGVVGAGLLLVSIGILNPLGYPSFGMALSALRHQGLFAGGAFLAVSVWGVTPSTAVFAA